VLEERAGAEFVISLLDLVRRVHDDGVAKRAKTDFD